MRRSFWIPFFMLLAAAGHSLTNAYADYFQRLGVAQSHVLIQGLQSDDLDMVYGAIRRIGELNITNARKAIWGWLGQANPVANAGKVRQGNSLKEILQVSIWAIGRIGTDEDAQELVNYIKDIRKDDHDTMVEIFRALGGIQPSPAAVRALNRFTQEITDERDSEILLASILQQNSQSSANYLIVMSKKVNFSAPFRKRLEAASVQLAVSGN